MIPSWRNTNRLGIDRLRQRYPYAVITKKELPREEIERYFGGCSYLVKDGARCYRFSTQEQLEKFRSLYHV